jgi:ABC-type transport system substrate-binding protein
VTAGILLNLTLPNSRIRQIVSLIAYRNAVLPGVFEGRGAAPDFEVPQTLDDAIAGRDTALDFTLRLIQARLGAGTP